ncbi:MAG: hypothetical protein P8J46_06225 [Alphaproteobacteria bacterium]|nr:hypothetical protein [Alphaproteobacteria bacterium]
MISLIFKITFFFTFFFISNLYSKVTLANIVVISYESFNNKDFNIKTINDHIYILTKKKYFIFSTNNIVNLINNSESLPDYSVAIVISSNNKQIIDSIWPIFSKASLAFTLFIDPYLINRDKTYMSWDDINKLKNNGIEIGIRSSSRNIINDINLYKNKLNIDPVSYIYKEGIWSKKVIEILDNNNIKIAFTDNSGPISKNMEKYKLSRFNVSGKFSDTERLETVLDALPLEITDILPQENTIIDNPPLYGFTLTDEKHIPQCYTNNKNKADVIIINKNRVEVRTKFFSGSKARINCVSKNANNRLLWHGSLYWVKK